MFDNASLSAWVPNSKLGAFPSLPVLDDLNVFCSKPELSMLCSSRCRRTTSASFSSLESNLICGPEGGEIDRDRDLFLVFAGDRDLLDDRLLDDFLPDFRLRSLREDRSLLESRERL